MSFTENLQKNGLLIRSMLEISHKSSSPYLWEIKNKLKRRKESNTYLATDSRHHQSLWHSSAEEDVQVMKAAVPAESYTLYPLSSRSADSGDVYWQ